MPYVELVIPPREGKTPVHILYITKMYGRRVKLNHTKPRTIRLMLVHAYHEPKIAPWKTK